MPCVGPSPIKRWMRYLRLQTLTVREITFLMLKVSLTAEPGAWYRKVALTSRKMVNNIIAVT